MNITLTEFIHPQDDAARRQLEAIPGFSTVLKAYLRIGYEELSHGLNMAGKIRLSEKQLPDLYGRLGPICRRLGITEPEFYLEMNPVPNAYTYGDSRIFLTITSGLVEYLTEEELDAVLAHECGHIACRHVLYHTMAELLIKGGSLIKLASNLVFPVRMGLLYWSRRSELSADRAAAAVMKSATPVVETMVRLSGGPKFITGKVDITAYAEQAIAYDALCDSKWDKVLQSYVVMQQSHPFPAVRVREILKWTNGDHFTRLTEALGLDHTTCSCPQCGCACESTWRFCKLCGAKLTCKTSEEDHDSLV